VIVIVIVSYSRPGATAMQTLPTMSGSEAGHQPNPDEQIDRVRVGNGDSGPLHSGWGPKPPVSPVGQVRSPGGKATSRQVISTPVAVLSGGPSRTRALV
jgi:hypothetical protein